MPWALYNQGQLLCFSNININIELSPQRGEEAVYSVVKYVWQQPGDTDLGYPKCHVPGQKQFHGIYYIKEAKEIINQDIFLYINGSISQSLLSVPE